MLVVIAMIFTTVATMRVTVAMMPAITALILVSAATILATIAMMFVIIVTMRAITTILAIVRVMITGAMIVMHALAIGMAIIVHAIIIGVRAIVPIPVRRFVEIATGMTTGIAAMAMSDRVRAGHGVGTMTITGIEMVISGVDLHGKNVKALRIIDFGADRKSVV